MSMLLTAWTAVKAQWDVQFSDYTALKTYYNPAAAGTEGLLDVKGLYSMQMVGYDDEMSCHCLGTISELFDGNPPFTGRGAISFAMNVAEILRALELLEKYQY